MRSPLEEARMGIEDDFRQANSFTAARFNRVSRMIAPGAILPTQFNRQIDVLATPTVAAGGGSNTYPFQLTDGTVVLGTPLLAVASGTMQDIVPTGGVGSTVSLGSTGTFNVYLDTTVDLYGNVTACALTASTSAMPANTSYDGYIMLGQVVVANVGGHNTITSISQFATHSLRCGIAGRQVVSGSLSVPGTFEFWGF